MALAFVAVLAFVLGLNVAVLAFLGRGLNVAVLAFCFGFFVRIKHIEIPDKNVEQGPDLNQVSSIYLASGVERAGGDEEWERHGLRGVPAISALTAWSNIRHTSTTG